mmetsp:Transcript_10348/g.38151  ORF Transcript_10348/g.38151 Transcript_10348/m.38151 type:complete len:133 (-) Transcript_10348:1188-1586(-)
MSVGAMSTAPPAFSLQCNRTLAPHGGASTRGFSHRYTALSLHMHLGRHPTVQSVGRPMRQLVLVRAVEPGDSSTPKESEEEQPKPWEQEPLDEDDVTVPGNKVVREAITDVYEMADTERQVLNEAFALLCKL